MTTYVLSAAFLIRRLCLVILQTAIVFGGPSLKAIPSSFGDQQFWPSGLFDTLLTLF
jgi:hypothetical protein